MTPRRGGAGELSVCVGAAAQPTMRAPIGQSANSAGLSQMVHHLRMTAPTLRSPKPEIPIRASRWVLLSCLILFAPPAAAATNTVTGTMSVTGTLVPGGRITYTVLLTSSGTLPQYDNPGDEFTDVLPEGLTLVSASASSGGVAMNVATNTVTWSGAINSETITITATIKPGTAGTSISNQGTPQER
jgi:uncharacterized repeat protein (TIGR01451 family)